jgi:hypothetical protein
MGYVDGALFVTLATVQLSVAAALPSDTPEAVHKPASVLTVTFGGQVITGASTSLMVTVKLQVAVLPLLSVTRYVLVVNPSGKVPPLPIPAVCVVMAPAQLSVPSGAV